MVAAASVSEMHCNSVSVSPAKDEQNWDNDENNAQLIFIHFISKL